jgi:hypothetical protein
MFSVAVSAAGAVEAASRNPLNSITASSRDRLGGKATLAQGRSGETVVSLAAAGDYALFKGCDFDSGVAGFRARISAAQGGVLEIHLDAPNGKLLGSCRFPASRTGRAWREIRCPVNNALAGVRDVYLVLARSESPAAVSLSSFQFQKSLGADAKRLALGSADRVDAPDDEPQSTNAWGMPERVFAEGFESQPLQHWSTQGLAPTARALAGSGALISPNTNLNFAYATDVYLNKADTGGEWRSMSQGAVTVDIALDTEAARPAAGFASRDGQQWVYVTLNSADNALEAWRKLADGTRTLIHKHVSNSNAAGEGWTLRTGTTYRLQVDWSPYSGGLIAFLRRADGTNITSFRTVIDLPSARRPLLLCQGGEARFDQLVFDPNLDAWNLKWQWKKTPVLSPDVCNPAVWKWKDGNYYMMWRKFGHDTFHGIAMSSDAVNWTRVHDEALKCTGDMSVLKDPFGDGLVYVTPGGENMPWWASDGSDHFMTWSNTGRTLGNIYGNSRIQEIIDTRQYPQLKPVEFRGHGYRFIGFTENWVAKPQPHTVVLLSDTLTNWVLANPEPLIPPGNQFWGEKGNAIGSAFVLPDGNILISSCSCTYDGYTGASEPSNVTAIADGRQPWKLLRLATLPDAPVSRERVWYQGPNFGTAFVYEPQNDTLFYYGGFHDYYIGMMRVEHFSQSTICRSGMTPGTLGADAIRSPQTASAQ